MPTIKLNLHIVMAAFTAAALAIGISLLTGPSALALTVNGFVVGPGADLSMANLVNANLEGVDLTGANLTGADLRGANLRGANLTGANLTIAQLDKAGLADANLTDANLTFAVMTRATLRGTILKGSNLTGTNLFLSYLNEVSSGSLSGVPDNLPTGWKISAGYLIGPSANLRGADLTGADLRGATLTGIISGSVTGTPTALPTDWQLINGYLVGPGADLRGAILTGLNLGNANLDGASLFGVTSGGITGMPSSLPLGFKLFGGYLIGYGVNLAGADLHGADLSDMNLSWADLSNAHLQKTNLTRTIFSWSNLKNVNFAGATMASADLGTIAQANLAGIRSGNIIGTPRLPNTEWKLIKGYLIGPTANLNGANLDGADLGPAKLYGVTSGGITGEPSSLPIGWKLANGYLIGPGADLAGAKLTGVNLENANLSFSDLNGVTSGGVTGTPVLPIGWTLLKGYLIGPGANLANADLIGANLLNSNLTSANLSNANLTGANLSNATLTNVNLEAAKLAHATLTGIVSGSLAGVPVSLPETWKTVNGFLVGPSSNLRNADLSSADLRGLDLTGADFRGANLRFANLNGAKLNLCSFSDSQIEEANFAGSTISSATFGGESPAFWSIWDVDAVSGLVVGTRVMNSTPSPAVSGAFKVGQTLNATLGSWDNGTAVTIQWMRNGVAIDSATQTTYVLTENDLGKLINVETTGTKTGYVTVKTTSTATKVEAGTQALTPVPTVAGSFKVGQTLNATPGSWDSGVAISYQWLRDGVSIVGAMDASYLLSPSDLNRQVSLRVTGTRLGYATVVKESAGTKIAVGSMQSQAPRVTGAPKPASTLRASTNAWVSGAKISYQWLSNGLAIKGATGATFKLSPTYKGKKISVKVTQVAKGYKTASSTSATVTVTK
jgi:uncharacterized protein YjbI with pentapeptide repeats